MKLNAFPPGLIPLYERMIQQIYNSEYAGLCKQILAAIAIVYQPITLTELASLVKMVEDIASDLDAVRDIISFCGSFLTIQGDSIYIVHQSAKDFFYSQRPLMKSSHLE